MLTILSIHLLAWAVTTVYLIWEDSWLNPDNPPDCDVYMLSALMGFVWFIAWPVNIGLWFLRNLVILALSISFYLRKQK